MVKYKVYRSNFIEIFDKRDTQFIQFHNITIVGELKVSEVKVNFREDLVEGTGF